MVLVGVGCDVRQFEGREPRTHQRGCEKCCPEVLAGKIFFPAFMLPGQQRGHDTPGDFL